MPSAEPCPDSQEQCDRAPLCTYDEARACRKCLCTIPPRAAPQRNGTGTQIEAPDPPITAPPRNVPLP